ncbi:MAG: hypothetical protein JWN17_2702, partial [Frankiales bacterium]|nr:hypothetical protein [Frankiales bacterium]
MLRRVVLLLVPVAVLAVLSPVPGRAATPLSFSPNAAFTDTPTSVTLTSSAAFSGTTGSVLLTPTAPATGPSYTVPLTAAGTTGTRWDAAVQLADPVTGTPAAPGLYDAVVTVGDEDQTCTACFTVLTRTEPRIHSCADVTPRRLQRGEDLPAVVVGSSFADGTVVEALEGKAASSHVVYSGPDTAAAGNDSGVLLSRSVHVEPDAPLGYYGVRVTNADGRTSTLERCLVVTASADKVEPTGVTNDMSRTLRLTVPDTLPKTATLRLFWVGPGAPAPQLDLPATGSTVVPANPSVPGDPSTITGTVNFVGATPSLNGYQAGYVLPDGSQHGCDGLCRFTVRQALPPVITGVKGLGTGSSLTRKVTLTGTGFTRGTTVQTDDPDVAVKSVAWTSTTSMTMTVLVAPTVDDTHPVTL